MDTTVTVPLEKLKERHDEYIRGVRALRDRENQLVAELENTRRDIFATAGSADALAKLVKEMTPAPTEKTEEKK